MYHLNIYVPSGWVSTKTVYYRVCVVGWVRDQVCRATCLADRQGSFFTLGCWAETLETETISQEKRYHYF